LAGYPRGPPGDFPELSSDFVLIDRELAAASTEHDKAALRNRKDALGDCDPDGKEP
jgi:hypothetical protein